MRVSEVNYFAAVGFDGENADFEAIATLEFKQGGIFGLSNDVFVNAAGFVGGKEFGLDHFAADFHFEFVELRAFGEREQERAFELLRVWVVELLVDGDGGDLVFDFGVDRFGGNFQRREREMARRRNRARKMRGRIDARFAAPVTDDD